MPPRSSTPAPDNPEGAPGFANPEGAPEDASAIQDLMEKYRGFCHKWEQGCGAVECGRAHMVVFYFGDLPCDVLLIGEAPGKSEDALGGPFQGPAGRLLQGMVARAVRAVRRPLIRVGYTNIVGCIPRDESGRKINEPSDDQVISCQPRLLETITLASPRLVVLVGRQAEDWVDFGPPYHGYRHALRLPAEVAHVSVMHPAAILRANEAHQGLLVQRCVVTLQNALIDVMESMQRSRGSGAGSV
jgi:uracil-DNA glycosylase family 4